MHFYCEGTLSFGKDLSSLTVRAVYLSKLAQKPKYCSSLWMLVWKYICMSKTDHSWHKADIQINVAQWKIYNAKNDGAEDLIFCVHFTGFSFWTECLLLVWKCYIWFWSASFGLDIYERNSLWALLDSSAMLPGYRRRIATNVRFSKVWTKMLIRTCLLNLCQTLCNNKSIKMQS